MSHPALAPVREVEFSAPQKVGNKMKVFVIPGTVHLAYPVQAKSVQWRNNTGGTVRIWLANLRDVLVPLHGEDLSQPIDIADGDDLVVGVRDTNAVFLKDYPVYCDAIGDYGDGDSSPHVGCP